NLVAEFPTPLDIGELLDKKSWHPCWSIRDASRKENQPFMEITDDTGAVIWYMDFNVFDDPVKLPLTLNEAQAAARAQEAINNAGGEETYDPFEFLLDSSSSGERNAPETKFWHIEAARTWHGLPFVSDLYHSRENFMTTTISGSG